LGQRRELKNPWVGKEDVFSFILKWLERAHPEPVHWWLLVHSSQNPHVKNISQMWGQIDCNPYAPYLGCYEIDGGPWSTGQRLVKGNESYFCSRKALGEQALTLVPY